MWKEIPSSPASTMPPSDPVQRIPAVAPGHQNRPSEMLRATLTVLLCLYLVGFALCLAGNSGSGASAVVRTVKSRLFSPWMTPAWLDVGHDVRLTYGQPEDGGHRIEIRPWADLSRGRTIVYPTSAIWGERAARWGRLARAIAVGEQDPDREGLLPAAVGVGGFRLVGAEDVSLRVLRQMMPESAVIASGGKGALRFEQAYAARVRRVAGEIQLLTIEDPAELAPLVPEVAP